jgi:hypothetical protein
MITCHRVTKATEVLLLWPFFLEGFQSFYKKHGEFYDMDELLKSTCALAADPIKGFVATVSSGSTLEGFGIMEDVSPIFSTEHTFFCRAFWHQFGNLVATTQLMDFFEQWAREHGVSSYTVTTKRNTGAAIRCFQSEKYGFRKHYITFVKYLQ